MRKWLVATLIVSSGAVALGGYEYWHIYSSRDQQLIRACRTVVLEHLVSPSSAKFVDRSYVGHGETAMRAKVAIKRAAAMMDEKNYDTDAASALLATAQATRADKKGEIVVAFDSANRMGAVLRGDALCTYEVSANGKDIEAEVASVGLDQIE